MSDGSEWSRKGGPDFEAERMPTVGGGLILLSGR